MAGIHSVWFLRLPADVRRRVELAEAAAREARYNTHAAQALDLVAVLAPRMPFDDAVDHYIDNMDLGPDDAEVVRTRALSLLGQAGVSEELARERHRTGWGLDWRYATPLGAVRFVRRQLERSAEEDLWDELAAARAEEALIRTHVRHARIFVDLLDKQAAPPQAVSLYIDRLAIPAGRALSVYQRALAEVADEILPRLGRSERQGEALPEPVPEDAG